jgi:cytochrome c oxidase cbb3-type subunit 3
VNDRAVALAVLILLLTACGNRPPVDSQVVPPGKILDFGFLYAENCAGCHGSDGKGGVAIGLGDPAYLAIAGDAAIREITAKGVAGTEMPAFALSAGGFLTDEQIDSIVNGIRSWAKPGFLHDANPPPYRAQAPGDPKRGANVYDTYCSSCHGAGGRGGGHGNERGSSIVDASYLTLVSNQSLRTTIILGRPELGAPDWRGDVPGKPMSAENVSDVVSWLAAQRPQTAAQVVGGIR